MKLIASLEFLVNYLAVGKFALNINNRKKIEVTDIVSCENCKSYLILAFFLTLSFRERHAIKCFYSHFKQMKF